MVWLDRPLIVNALRFITGENVHRVREMVFVYEKAVSLHNTGWPSQRVYDDRYEQELRQFVFRERMKTCRADALDTSVNPSRLP
jgi:hypothetical protein